MADGTYESDLHQAILQSKLDYEENKELYDQLKKEQEEEGKKPAKKKKSNKAQPMTLGQFNSLTENQVSTWTFTIACRLINISFILLLFSMLADVCMISGHVCPDFL